MKRNDAENAEAGFVSAFLRIAEILVWAGGVLSSLLILFIFALVSFAILRRYVFDMPLLWGDELIGYLLVAAVMLGAAEALRRNDHISIELLAGRSDGKWRVAVGAIGNLSVIVFAAILGWSALKSIQFARAFGSYSIGYIEIETWIPQVPLLLGAALLAMAASVRLIRLFAADPAP
jgi:TRAP-type C4-dicarboxylate transport system permease small subunit